MSLSVSVSRLDRQANLFEHSRLQILRLIDYQDHGAACGVFPKQKVIERPEQLGMALARPTGIPNSRLMLRSRSSAERLGLKIKASR